jgi:hypothetical protein
MLSENLELKVVWLKMTVDARNVEALNCLESDYT